MSNIQPIYPPWAKPNCEVLRTYFEVISSGTAVGDSKWCVYLDAKGKEQTTMMWVEWRKI